MRRFAYALLVLFWIAGIALWLRRERAPAALAVTPESQPAESQPHALEAAPVAAKPRPPPAAHRRALPGAKAEAESTLLHVRSSVGLPLLFAEGRIEGGEWERLDLLDGTTEIEPDAPAFRMRAPGHAEIDVQKGALEVVLEPDALLAIHSKNLRTRVRDLAVFRRARSRMAGNEFERLEKVLNTGLLAEFPDADQLLVAYSPALLAQAYPGDVEVEFACNDGPKVEIELRPVSGLRGSWELPPADTSSSAALDLALTDEGARPDSIRIRLHALERERERESKLDFAWGRVSLSFAALPEFPDTTYGKPDRTRLEGLPLGRRYAVTGTDSNGRFGRIEFVHDGGERTLVLQAPFTVAGSVVDARDSSALPRSDVRCYPKGKPEDRSWSTRTDSWREDAGRFELPLLGWHWDEDGGTALQVPPGRFTLVASAKGHRSATLEFDWDGKASVDVGTIALPPNSLPIVLVSEGLRLEDAVDVSALTFGDEPALQWSVKHLVSRGFGESELELDFADEPPSAVPCTDLRTGESSNRPFTRVLAEILCFSAGDEPFVFRQGKQAYEPLAQTLHAVRIECEELPDSGTWTIGWSGAGTWAGFRKASAKGPVVDTLALPAIATELWWSAGEAPPQVCKRAGGTLALESGPQTLVLR